MANETATIRKSDLCIDWLEDGTVRIVRQSNGNMLELTISEVAWIGAALEFYSVPVVPAIALRRRTKRNGEEKQEEQAAMAAASEPQA